MAIDPRYLDPNYWSSLPIGNGLMQEGGAGFGGISAYPSSIHVSQIPNLLATFQGQRRGLQGAQFTPFNADYIKNNPYQAAVGGDFAFDMSGYEQKPLAELSGYFGFNDSDSVFASLSPGAKSYLKKAEAYQPWGLTGGSQADWDTMTANYGQWTPQQIQAQFTPQDYATIESAIQPYRTADRLYMQEMLRRAQAGDIDIETPDRGFMGSLFAAVPGIVGAWAGGPIGGAVGGAISGNLSGGGLKGMLAGALTGGIAGNGGIVKTLNGLGAGGPMNTITNAISGFTNSSWNPFSIGNIQGLLPDSVLNSSWGTGLSEALSGAIPGALLGGALDGWQGAGIGGLLGGALGYGANQYGTSGPLSLGGGINQLFGMGGASGGAGGGTGGFGGTGGAGGFGGALGGLFGGGGNTLAQLLGAGIPLALLTREASKVSDTPTSLRTPYSSVRDGFTDFDPAIRGAMMENMNNTRGLYNEAGGNQGAYIQARVNPLMQQIAQRQGQLEQSLGRRGVAGSSFGDQALNVFGLDSQRALGDARAMATNEALGMRGQLNNGLAQGSELLLRQELGALGLADQNIQNLLARAKIRSDIFGRAAAGAGDILSGLR